jgi:DNA-binding IclR family transcriptional regulator
MTGVDAHISTGPKAPRISRRHDPPTNYTALRTMRALEALAFAPASAPALAGALGIHPRTARRLLSALVRERYIEPCHAPKHGRRYQPTVHLLALAVQLARRLPLVHHGQTVVADLHRRTGLTAYLAVPSYADVLVLDHAGDTGPWPWDLLPATASAAGQILAAHRTAWRRSLDATGTLEEPATARRSRAHAFVADDAAGSIAVAVPQGDEPLAALCLAGVGADLGAHETWLTLLHRSALFLAERLAPRDLDARDRRRDR